LTGLGVIEEDPSVPDDEINVTGVEDFEKIIGSTGEQNLMSDSVLDGLLEGEVNFD